MTAEPSAASLLLNGPFSSGNAGTRAFLSQNIRKRRGPQEPLALWVGPLSKENSSVALESPTASYWAGLCLVDSGASSGTVCLSRITTDVNAAAMELDLSDFCVFLRPTQYLCRSEVSSPH